MGVSNLVTSISMKNQCKKDAKAQYQFFYKEKYHFQKLIFIYFQQSQ